MRDFWVWNFGCVYGSWWFAATSQLIDRITILYAHFLNFIHARLLQLLK